MPILTPLKERYRSVQEKEAYVRKLFSDIDANYDFMNRFMSLGLDMTWRRKAVRTAKFAAQGLLLDVASGTGDLSLSALKINPGAKIIGLDFCQPLLFRAKQKFSKINTRQTVNWVQGNALHLPFADNTFDGVLTGFSLRNVAGVEQLFSEFYRVTRPGGKFVAIEMVKQERPLNLIIFNIHFKQVVPLLGRLLTSHPDAYSYLPLSIENFYTADQLLEIISKTGWKEVCTKSFMFGFVVAHFGMK
ncbi:hypothetical protein DRN98_10580 [Methanosarcinales archaeon]|nr:MAG: hypothetical protein DRN98_10580 [Methanosarcinales archaeon]